MTSGAGAIPLQKRGRAASTAFLTSVAIALSAGLLVAASVAVFGPEERQVAARATRAALLLGFAASFAVLRTIGRPPLLQACGFAPADRPGVSYLRGFLAGAIPVVLLILVLTGFGARSFEVRGGIARLSWLGAKFLVLGFPFVAIEEGLFRGLLLGDAVRRMGTTAGTALAAVFFAATHFLGASESWRESPRPAGSAVDIVVAIFSGTSRLIEEWPEFVGLTLVGVVLSVLRLRAGHAYLAMGVHAGWYWVKQMDRYFVQEIDAVVLRNPLWIGSEQYLDGAIGWAALLGSLALACALPLSASEKSPE